MRSAIMRALVSAVAIVICGCGGVEDEGTPESVFNPDPGTGDKVPVHHFNEGDICFYEGGYPDAFVDMSKPQRFEEHSVLAVTVATPECLSQTCDIDRIASCSIDRYTDIIEVTSYLGYTEVDATMCTMDCGQVVARCQSEPLPAGDYHIVHGGNYAQLTVPSTVAACSGNPMRPDDEAEPLE
jgi:hypothetical protein